jgi:ribosomal-protein-alanine N-acetyltransferase
VILDTARLRLRPYTLDDVDALHGLWTDPDVRRYLWDNEIIPRERAALEVDQSIASFQANGFGSWTLRLRDGESLAGFCGLRTFGDPPQVEVLYGMAPAVWGRGLATEAVGAVLEFGFKTCGLERIIGRTDTPNVASVRVMEKAGMKLVGREQHDGLELVCFERRASES